MKPTSQQKVIFEAIKAISGQSKILTIPRLFIDLTGSLESALLLSQCIYWSDKGQDGWFYKSYHEWKVEITLSEYQIRKAAKFLCNENILKTKLKKANGSPILHYKIDVDALIPWFLKKLQNPSLKNSRNIYTEITTLDCEGKIIHIRQDEYDQATEIHQQERVQEMFQNKTLVYTYNPNNPDIFRPALM